MLALFIANKLAMCACILLKVGSESSGGAGQTGRNTQQKSERAFMYVMHDIVYTYDYHHDIVVECCMRSTLLLHFADPDAFAFCSASTTLSQNPHPQPTLSLTALSLITLSLTTLSPTLPGA